MGPIRAGVTLNPRLASKDMAKEGSDEERAGRRGVVVVVKGEGRKRSPGGSSRSRPPCLLSREALLTGTSRPSYG
jgi:hypothetical protein